ncbi:hypothetical protein Tco_0189481 [Tanacetum coccineum]
MRHSWLSSWLNTIYINLTTVNNESHNSLASISKLEFIPLLDGTYTSLSRGVVWLSIDKTAFRGFEKVYLKLCIVNPGLISDIENVNENVTEMLVNPPSTSLPQHSEPSPATEEHVPTPHDSPLHSVHSHGSDEGRLQQPDLMDVKWEKQVKSGKARRKAKLVLSEDEDITDVIFKHGRKISDIDADPTISLMQDSEMTWFQENSEV